MHKDTILEGMKTQQQLRYPFSRFTDNDWFTKRQLAQGTRKPIAASHISTFVRTNKSSGASRIILLYPCHARNLMLTRQSNHAGD